MISSLYGLLTVISLALMLVSAVVASAYVTRLRKRESTPVGEALGSARDVVRKIRKREPMTEDELYYARQVVADRCSPLALSIPGMIFMLGCFYVFGSLEHLHGATPSERTFLGVIPMLTSTNLALRMLSHVRLKRRLRKAAN
ncbi:hypothetical protein BST27_28100 [Mycobacterium intermedium]|uniref:Uncharacterized protein n=1 Tax=Mycobacterium intermedium TaxID=28445 RepID=A0A1E3S5B4_MYCIE|nr:hypothetical protein [Mycobacterium intermedium]MCV6964144.1 hypothetical protein [Mycobacterium intermedium]ODQ97329.1 hypothetical protein BHQ20_26890 [Mycobacterium intermedium]OPE46061.1 hypothetical protein BV508_27350 [Mycobacterium intermedium]ORA94332.1 hypothetical protein BST27_28100 [Mycobacterium intermedium]